MNIYFYSSSGSGAAKIYLEKLKKLPTLEEMIPLPKGSLFLSPLALKLRSGDMLLLFISNKHELDELLAMKSDFFEYRLIVILANYEMLRKAYLLCPSFIAFHDEEMTKIWTIIHNNKESETLCQEMGILDTTDTEYSLEEKILERSDGQRCDHKK